MLWLKMAGNEPIDPWGRHGGGDIRLLDAAERQALSKSIGSYVDRAVAFDPYLSSLGMDPDRDHGGGIWIGPAKGSLLRYWSDEEPYSKTQGRSVVASLAVIFSTEDPPAWMRGTERWDDAEAARHEFRNFHARVQYFDPDDGGRIAEAYKGPATMNVMEAIEGAKRFMASDLVMGGSGPKREPSQAPIDAPTIDAPTEMITACSRWVMASCKFASYNEMALISPDGRVFDTGGMSHPDWANENWRQVGLNFNPIKTIDYQPTDDPNEAVLDVNDRDALDAFMDAGWIRVRPWFGVQVGWLDQSNVGMIKRIMRDVSKYTRGRSLYVDTGNGTINVQISMTGRPDFSELDRKAGVSVESV